MTRAEWFLLASIFGTVVSLVLFTVGAVAGVAQEEYAKGAFYLAWSISVDAASRTMKKRAESAHKAGAA